MSSDGFGYDDAIRVLDPDGEPVDDVEPPEPDSDTLLSMYEEMVFARRFDERAIKLQRQGRMGTYPPMAGQEGAQIGSAYAFRDGDRFVSSYREMAGMFSRGVPPEDVLAYWMGDERGNKVREHDVFPVNVPIGTQVPHATGLARADDLRDSDRVTVCYFGDGATSEGDFHEGMNFAGVFDVPAVFFCNNNQWAISVPLEKQTATDTIAQKSVAYGFDGVVVDGMDPLAVYGVTRRALEKARDPDDGQPRPTLIEAVQYRYGAHTTADDPSKYRSEEEVDRWRERDPIPRLESYLRREDLLDDSGVEEVRERCEERLEEAVEAAEELPPPEVSDIFSYVYEEETEELRRQREEAGRWA